MRTTTDLRPLVIVGAARSGTKVCREVIATAVGVPAVPFDVGYVWREGNESVPHDALHPELATPRAVGRIRGFLERYADSQGRVIEKTVGNALRIPVVARVLPEAQFVHLVRDGVDVAESSRREWGAPTDLAYLVRKLPHFPPRLVTSYGLKYLRTSLVRRDRARSWGPRYPGIDDDVQRIDILTVCARQWRDCVTTASADLDRVSAPVVEVRYEDLVSDPVAALQRIVGSLEGYEADSDRLARAAGMVVTGRLGKGRSRLTQGERDILGREIGDILERFGYEQP